jgi:hypothetical protein
MGGGGGATMTLYDHDDAALSLHSTGGVSGVSLFDHRATLLAVLDVEHDGMRVLKFNNRNGKIVKQLP